MTNPYAAPPRRSRKGLKITLAVVALLLLLVSFAPLLFSGLIRSQVEGALEGEVNGRVRIKELSLSWWSGVELERLEIKLPGAALPSVEVKSLSLRKSLFSLAAGGALKSELRLDGVRIRARSQDGVIDLQNLLKESKESSNDPLPEFDLAVRVKNLVLSFSDENETIEQSIDDLRVKLRSDENSLVKISGANGLLIDARGKLIEKGAFTPPDRLRVNGELAAERLDLRSFAGFLAPWCQRLEGVLSLKQSFSLEDGSLAISGPLGLENLSVALAGRSEVVRAKSLRLEAEGGVTTSGTGRGTLGIKGRKLHLAGLPSLKAPLDIERLDTTLDLNAKERIGVEKLQLRSSALNAEGEASVGYGPAFSCRAKLDLSSDLAKLSALLPDLPALKGQLTSDLDLDLRGDASLSLRGKTTILGFEAKEAAPGLPPLREERLLIQHDLDLGADSLAITNARLDSSFAKLDLGGTISTFWKSAATPSGSLRIRGNLDSGAVIALAAPELAHRPEGRIALDAALGARGQGYALQLTMNGPDLKLNSSALAKSPLSLGATKLVLDGQLGADGDLLDLAKVELSSTPLVAKLKARLDKISSPDDLSIALQGEASPRFDLLGPALVAQWTPGRFVDGKASFDLKREGRRLVVDRLHWKSPQLDATVSGRLQQRGQDQSGPLKLVARGDLQALRPFLGQAFPFETKGACALEANLDLGPEIGFRIGLDGRQWDLAGSSLGPEGLKLATLTLKSEGRYDPARNSTFVRSLELALPFANTRLRSPARILMAEDGPRGRFDLEGQVDLKALPRNLASLPEGLDAQGSTRMEVGIDLASTIVVERLKLDCKDLLLAQATGGKLAGRLAVNANLSGRGFDLRIDGRGLAVTPPGATRSISSRLVLEARGKQSDTPGQLALDHLRLEGQGLDLSGQLDWNPKGASAVSLKGDLALEEVTRNWLALFAPEISASGQGKLEVVAKIPAKDGAQDWEKASGSWSLRAPELRRDTLLLQELVIDGTLEGGIAKITKGAASLNGGTIALDGQLDLTKTPVEWTGDFGLQGLELGGKTKTTTARVVPVFGGRGVRLTGTAHANLHVDGKGQELSLIKKVLSGSGRLALEGGTIDGSPVFQVLATAVGTPSTVTFEPFDARFQIRDGAILQDGATLVSNAFDMELRGTTRLDGAINYIVRVRVKTENARWNRFAQVLDPQGYLPLKLGGTIDDPTLEPPDLKTLLQGIVPSLIPGKAGDALRGILKGQPTTPTPIKKPDPLGGALEVLKGLGGKKK